ncbi:PAS domain S-box protein [Trinickia sp. EG282A]|uniref:PAS domain S-box protein n=1 Tax=Trinickia sp. EG282A TaxID=3237013 RepID=UPI0034D1D47B
MEPRKPLIGLRQQLFQQVVEAAPNAMVMADRDGRIVFGNAQMEKLFGYSREELLGISVDRLVPERFRAAHADFRHAFYADLKTRPMGMGRDLFALRKDGSEFPVEIGLNPVTTDEGVFVLAAIADITERRRLEERFRQVVEAAPNAMVMVDREGRIVLVNSQTEKLFAYAREELFAKSIETLVPERLRGGHHSYREAYFDELQPRPMGSGRDLYGRRKDGSEFPVEIGLNPVRTSEEVFVLAAIADITQRKRAEHELLRSTEELKESRAELQRLSANIQHVREEEKARVARELHDDLGQQLAALKIEVGKIENRAEGARTAMSGADLGNVEDLIDRLVVSVRRIAADLRPAILDDLGLLPAIEWFTDEFTSRHRVRVIRHIAADDIEFNRKSATAIFRIVQESMMNVARHAGATEVTLEIECKGANCVVTITDNGHGCPSDERPSPNSFGLLGMRERAAGLNGELSIRTAPGRGFALSVSLPLAAIVGPE